MVSHIHFNILLTRATPAHDDKICIHADCDNEFTITYNDKMSKSVKNIVCDYQGLCDYIEGLRNSLIYDEIDPYCSVQIQFPMYPLLSLSRYTFCSDEFQETLGNMFDSVLSMNFC
jgi:hypothetical protein